jgi:hypothetical protein
MEQASREKFEAWVAKLKAEIAREIRSVADSELQKFQEAQESNKSSILGWRVNEHWEPHRATSASQVTIDGTFEGRFRTYTIDQPAAWVPAPFSR